MDIYEKDVFSLDYTLINQYDLVLTDVNLNLNRISSAILKISKVPTDAFWHNLETFLHST